MAHCRRTQALPYTRPDSVRTVSRQPPSGSHFSLRSIATPYRALSPGMPVISVGRSKPKGETYAGNARPEKERRIQGAPRLNPSWAPSFSPLLDRCLSSLSRSAPPDTREAQKHPRAWLWLGWYAHLPRMGIQGIKLILRFNHAGFSGGWFSRLPRPQAISAIITLTRLAEARPSLRALACARERRERFARACVRARRAAGNRVRRASPPADAP
ncbi:hypothetical protein OH77DRAFT_281647 [Trametes cingulata]|nr:hypothetical protein OH77DRAFT_281647 [Trametes cingulata]